MSFLDQLLGPLEIAMNRALAASPDALDTLSGGHETVALYLRDLGWGFRIGPVAHGVQLMPDVSDARATVSTSLVGLARLVAGEQPRAMGTALTLQGDAEYAERVMGALRGARIDLESELRSALGPLLQTPAAQGLERGLRGLFDRGRQGLFGLLTGAAESPAAGADGLADGAATRQWMDEVDEAVTALDRLEARIARLERGEPES